MIYIREWATKFPNYSAVRQLNQNANSLNDRDGFSSSSETEWLVVYNTLLKEHVTFPSREAKTAPKAQTHRNYPMGNSPMIAEENVVR